MDIMVPPREVENLEAELTGLNYSLMIPDVQKLIDLEKISAAGGHKVSAGELQPQTDLRENIMRFLGGVLSILRGSLFTWDSHFEFLSPCADKNLNRKNL